ncbi:DUF2244 domain-containing protein [Caballeronia sp. Lep1P3]|uniref:DUF2244 domain-containing protein n=1 Tax=Caballeronia sp. Lep1P3 TaxID=2878150 RepID=UPI001FD45CF4|nr:DUF2244 domain-containing protein [Caballeronia sp. Lep1P3]
MPAITAERQWRLARSASCSPARFAVACAGLSAIPVGFATAMHAMNGALVFYLLAFLHASLIWFCFLCYARHALDGDIVTLLDDVLVVESVRGPQRRTHRFNIRWAVLLVTQRGARVQLAIRCAGETLELGRYATQSRRLAFLSEFQRITRCEMTAPAAR